MANNTLGFSNRIRYTLLSNDFGSQVINDPEGWDGDHPELRRGDTDHGIMAISSQKLRFFDDAFEYLKSAYDIGGIKSDVRILREERNEDSDEWEESYEASLDFATYRQDKNYVEIKMNESVFFKNIDARMRDTFELDRLTDLKGNAIAPLQYRTLELEGRDIFRETLFQNKETITGTYEHGLFSALYDFAMPIQIEYASDDDFFTPTTGVVGGVMNMTAAMITRGFGDTAIYNGGTVYLLEAFEDKTITVNFDLTFRVRAISPAERTAIVRVYADIVESDFHSSTEEMLSENIFNEQSGWQTVTINHTTTYNLLEGQSLGLRVQPFFNGSYADTNQLFFEFENLTVRAIERQVGRTTICKCLTVYDVLYRLTWIITGKQTFYSELLQTAFWKDLLMTSGFLIREMPDKTISTSMEEVLDGLRSIDDIAMFIKGNQLRVETKRTAYQSVIGLDLGAVSNVERRIMDEDHYSSVEIGSEFNGVYEEVNGLDEPNIRTEYATSIDVLNNPLEAVSKIRSDSYGITLAQLKDYERFPKTDTPYDKVNFFIDAKLIDGVYYVRHWADDFPTAPTGIYSPQTAFNLRLSPFNSVLRKRRTIATGLQKYPNERFVYSSTEGNSNLVTLYPERADILQSVLGESYYLPEEISFEKKISLSDFRYLLNNPYFLVKFTNELGQDDFGYIKSINPNGVGKFILYKAIF